MEREVRMLDVVRYERLEGFIGLLKAADKKTPVYVDVVRSQSESGLLTMKISFMMIQDGFLHQCFFSEDMPVFRFVDESVFNVLSEPVRKQALDDYHLGIERYEAEVKAEYDAAADVIRQEGFTVVEGVVQ